MASSQTTLSGTNIESDSDDSSIDNDAPLEGLQGDLEKYVMDDEKVAPSDRVQYMIGLCTTDIEDFDTISEPYGHRHFDRKRNKFRVKAKFLLQEVKRRLPAAKGNSSNRMERIASFNSGPCWRNGTA